SRLSRACILGRMPPHWNAWTHMQAVQFDYPRGSTVSFSDHFSGARLSRVLLKMIQLEVSSAAGSGPYHKRQAGWPHGMPGPGQVRVGSRASLLGQGAAGCASQIQPWMAMML